jgi:hypothetical protein
VNDVGLIPLKPCAPAITVQNALIHAMVRIMRRRKKAER